MTNSSPQGHSRSFIVRIWAEAVGKTGEPTAWRGSIDVVGTQRRFYFQDLQSIVRFIRQEVGFTGLRRHSAWLSVFRHR